MGQIRSSRKCEVWPLLRPIHDGMWAIILPNIVQSLCITQGHMPKYIKPKSLFKGFIMTSSLSLSVNLEAFLQACPVLVTALPTVWCGVV
jgi:hypothetical protein